MFNIPLGALKFKNSKILEIKILHLISLKIQICVPKNYQKSNVHASKLSKNKFLHSKSFTIKFFYTFGKFQN